MSQRLKKNKYITPTDYEQMFSNVVICTDIKGMINNATIIWQQEL